LWQSVLFLEETGIPGENHQPAASHWQTVSHNVVSSGIFKMATVTMEMAKMLKKWS
jgi:hypothetical protein